MKIAQLHDNSELHFPDETPDEVMHAAVQQHLADMPPPEEPPVPDVVSAAHMVGQMLTDAFGHFLDQQENIATKDRSVQVAGVQEHVAATQAFQEQLAALAGAVSSNNNVVEAKQLVQLLGGICQCVNGIDAQLEQLVSKMNSLDNVTEAINRLTNAVSDSAEAILRSLAMRRELEFFNGKPVAIQQAERKN